MPFNFTLRIVLILEQLLSTSVIFNQEQRQSGASLCIGHVQSIISFCRVNHSFYIFSFVKLFFHMATISQFFPFLDIKLFMGRIVQILYRELLILFSLNRTKLYLYLLIIGNLFQQTLYQILCKGIKFCVCLHICMLLLYSIVSLSSESR